jgi:hypothetical protein
MDPTLTLIALLVLALAAVLLATTRVIREDRPATPPGGPWDWRADALAWNRLGIR